MCAGRDLARRVEELLNERAFTDQAWQRWRVKDGRKGPMIWEVEHALFTPRGEDGLPGEPMHLVVARNVLDPDEVKFYVSNATPETPLQKLLLAGGVLAPEGRALFRRPEERDRAGPVGRSPRSGVETAPDPELRELSVPVADARGVRGGETRS